MLSQSRSTVSPLTSPTLQRNSASQQSRYVTPDRLGVLLAERNVTRVWELREYGPEYELDAAVFEPAYNGAEGFWTSPTHDWIIYASHEASITVGGWMLAEVKRIWPEWERHIWTTPFFE